MKFEVNFQLTEQINLHNHNNHNHRNISILIIFCLRSFDHRHEALTFFIVSSDNFCK